MDSTGRVICLGWWRRWWVLGFQSHHVLFCLLSPGYLLPCTNKYTRMFYELPQVL